MAFRFGVLSFEDIMKMRILLWLIVPFLVVSIGIALSISAFHQIEENAQARTQTAELVDAAQDLLSKVRDAEVGQRGFVITGEERFLEPYLIVKASISSDLENLRKSKLSSDSRVSLDAMVPLIDSKMNEIARVIEFRQRGQSIEAIAAIKAGYGKLLMDKIRALSASFIRDQEQKLALQELEYQATMRQLFTVIVVSSILVMLFVFLFTYVAYREWKQRQQSAFHQETQRLLDLQRLTNQELNESNFNLSVSEEKLAVTLHSIGDAVIATDDQACVNFLNPLAEKLTGWTMAEAQGRLVDDVFHIISQETRLLAKIPVRDALEAGTVQGLANHTLLIARDGSERSIADSCAPIRARDNKVIGAVLVFHDVTEEYAARQKDLDNSVMVQTILNTVADGVTTVLLANGQIQTVNPAMSMLFGYSDVEMIDQAFRNLVPEFPLISAFSRGLTHEQNIPKIFSARRKDGSTFPLEIEMNGMELGGAQLFTGVLRDVSLRTALEEKQKLLNQNLKNLQFYTRSLIESNIDALMTTDIDGVITDVNHQMELLTACQRRNLIGSTFKSHFTDPQRAENGIQKVLIDKSVRNFELTVSAQDGTHTVVSYNASTLYDIDGQLKGVLAVARDVTVSKALELAMQEQNIELEKARSLADRANFAKSEFLATMSHEIRTPMNGVVGMIDVLQQSNLNAAQLEMTNIIHESAYALLTVINDILDFSKIEANKLEVEQIPISIRDVVEGVCDNMGHLASKKSVELTLYVDPLIPDCVLGDPGRLRQILINLANNAIKFSSELKHAGKVSVRALLTENSVDKINVSFQIRDNGIGIDDATKDKLFKAFTQADSSTTRRFGGTGLGLAITHQLVNLMQGSITVESSFDQGSLFSVLIPFELGGAWLDNSLKGGRLKKLESLQGLEKIKGMRCLILSNATTFSQDLTTYLRFQQVEVENCSSPSEAQEWIATSSERLRVIVIDMTESAGNGVDGRSEKQSRLELEGLRGLREENNVNGSLNILHQQSGEVALAQLRLLADQYPNSPVHFVLLGRGRRRKARLVDEKLAVIDANLLTSRDFLTAILLAVGVASAPARATLSNHAPDAPKQLSREEARLKGSLILVAEDNEINQKVILQQLMLLGQTADIANNGEEALNRWLSGDYGIVFADLHMPRMDGYELTTAIREAESSGAHVPIIAFTANALKGESERCLAIGMDDFLSKPVQLHQLKSMLEKWQPLIVSNPIRMEPEELEVPPQVSKHAVEVSVLKSLIGEDELLVSEFLQDYRVSANTIGREICDHSERVVGAEVAALAHKLKSSSRSVGALELGNLCEALELVGKQAPSALQPQLMAEFRQELQRVDEFLRLFSDSHAQRESAS